LNSKLFGCFCSENARMRSTQARQATQDPAIRGFNERNNFITFQVD
jgi:hypothetical protein